jgi:hypothetical protein
LPSSLTIFHFSSYLGHHLVTLLAVLIAGLVAPAVTSVAFWVTSSCTEEVVHHSLLLASARFKFWVCCLFHFHSALMLAEPTNFVHVFSRLVVTCQDNILFPYRHYFCRRLFSNWPKIDVSFLLNFIVMRFVAEHFVELGSSSLPFVFPVLLSVFFIHSLPSFLMHSKREVDRIRRIVCLVSLPVRTQITRASHNRVFTEFCTCKMQ